MSDLSTRVRLRREQLGLSQQELARRMGYRSRSSITKLEKGINDLPQSKVEELAQALETTPAALLGLESAEHGVDSLAVPQDAAGCAVALARQLGCVVLLSGVEDLVTDGGEVLHITGGCDRMRMVTGAGCMLSVLCGAFAAVQPQAPLQAAADAARFWKLCAARAGQNALGPGSLRAALLDSAAALTDAEFSPQ